MFVQGTQIYLAIFPANVWPFIYKNTNVLYYYGLQNQILKNTAMVFFVCSAVKLVYIFHLIDAFYYVWVVFLHCRPLSCILQKIGKSSVVPAYGFPEIHYNENMRISGANWNFLRGNPMFSLAQYSGLVYLVKQYNKRSCIKREENLWAPISVMKTKD